jgi:hypothetical protein
MRRAYTKLTTTEQSDTNISDKPRIYALLQAIGASERPARRSGQSEAFSSLEVCGNQLSFRPPVGLQVGDTVSLEVDGYASVYAMTVTVQSMNEDRVFTDMPGQVHRLRSRSRPRTRVLERVWFGAPVERFVTIVDVAVDAFSATAESPILCFSLGAEVHVSVTLPGERTATMYVRVARTSVDGPNVRYGCRIISDHADSNWRDFALEVAHQRTRQISSAAEVVSLFERSGYFATCTDAADTLEHGIAAFAATSDLLRRAPQIACQVGWNGPHGLLGTASQLRLYSGTWFGYHLAKLKDTGPIPGRRILRELHLHSLEHTLADPQLRYFMTLVQHGTRFTKFATLDFLDRYSDEQAAAIPVELLCGDVASLEPRAPTDRSWARFATADEHRIFFRFIEGVRGEIFRQALDLCEDVFSLDTTRSDWARAGLRRERSLIAAGDDDTACSAFAVVEHVEPGIHLFDFLCAVRIYRTAQATELAIAALLTRVASWYRERGARRFVVYDEERAYAGKFGLRSIGHATLAIMHESVLPEYLDHYYENLSVAPSGTSLLPPPLEQTT